MANLSKFCLFTQNFGYVQILHRKFSHNSFQKWERTLAVLGNFVKRNRTMTSPSLNEKTIQVLEKRRTPTFKTYLHLQRKQSTPTWSSLKIATITLCRKTASSLLLQFCPSFPFNHSVLLTLASLSWLRYRCSDYQPYSPWENARHRKARPLSRHAEITRVHQGVYIVPYRLCTYKFRARFCCADSLDRNKSHRSKPLPAASLTSL